jgi:hypothetical protein
MKMTVPITDPLWRVQLAQKGLLPSPQIMAMARLLEAIRQDQAAKEAMKQRSEGDDKR